MDKVVSVLCTCYNHEAFIRNAIEGVLMQETTFPYELIIHDDASTDGSAEIIRQYADRYPDKIRVILQKENQCGKRGINLFRDILFPAVRGRYIALCEGDDYWTDREKLQKQVDFLESHPDYSMSMHNAVKLVYETGEERLLNTFPDSGTYSQEEQIKAGLGKDFPAFASYVMRADLLKEMPDFFFDAWIADYPFRQYLANVGKIYYFAEPMSVYRTGVPMSMTRKIAEDEAFYNDYTIRFIHFYEKLDDYTDKRFDGILQQKIVSDYLGFCTSVEPEKGKKIAAMNGLGSEKIDACYRAIDRAHLDDSIVRMKEECSDLFVYGTSRLSKVCREQLDGAGIGFAGFVVSDNQAKQDSVDGKPVYYLSDVMDRFQNPGFILAVQPINIPAIEGVLKEHGVEHYCMPYRVDVEVSS